MTGKRILIVDDEPEMAEVIADTAIERGLDPNVITNSKAVLEQLNDPEIAGAFIDIVMPDIDGIELMGLIGKSGISIPVVLMTGYNPLYLEAAEFMGNWRGAKVVGSLQKPFRVDEIDKLLTAILEHEKETGTDRKSVV